MNTSEEMRKRVGKVTMDILGDRSVYGVIESKVMAIDRVRRELETQLESDMNNPYGNGPEWATARLTLFNSMYR